MKNSLKIGLLAVAITVSAAGCSGCHNGKETKGPVIDTNEMKADSPKKATDTSAKVKADTTKKDTTKIK